MSVRNPTDNYQPTLGAKRDQRRTEMRSTAFFGCQVMSLKPFLHNVWCIILLHEAAAIKGCTRPPTMVRFINIYLNVRTSGFPAETLPRASHRLHQPTVFP